MAFVHRAIAVTVSLGRGSFGEGGFDRVKLSGQLRASAQVTASGGPSFAQLDLSISGMSLSQMNAIATLGPTIQDPEQIRRNEVVVEAGDVDKGLGVVYNGVISEAALDFSGMPNCSLRITAMSGTMLAMRPVPPTSYRGLVDVVTIFSSLCQQAQVPFINNGVTANLIDPYLCGTVWDQMQRCADAANINWMHDASVERVIIWPKDGSRGGAVPIVDADHGMIGYPSFTNLGIWARCLYNPSISIGTTVQINSTLKGGTGRFVVGRTTHNLESETPGGQWATQFFAIQEGKGQLVSTPPSPTR